MDARIKSGHDAFGSASSSMAEGKDQQESAPKRSGKKAAKAEGAPAPAPAAGAGQSHAALARKYRPKLFSELIGQDAMVQTLRNAFASGRIAQAYMLTGVRGVGKTTTARLIARALNYVPRGGEGAPLGTRRRMIAGRARVESSGRETRVIACARWPVAPPPKAAPGRASAAP